MFEGVDFRVFGAQAHDHIAIHLDEAAVDVVTKALVTGFFYQAGDDLVVEAEVQHGFHHAGHRDPGAGAHREQQRVFRVAEFGAHLLFDLADGLVDLGA